MAFCTTITYRLHREHSAKKKILITYVLPCVTVKNFREPKSYQVQGLKYVPILVMKCKHL